MPPGKEGNITLAIPHTEGYQGEVAKSATVTTNDPARATFYLTLRAYFRPVETADGALGKNTGNTKVSGVFAISPNDRWTTSALTGSSTATTIYLYNRSDKPVQIKQVEAGGSSFKVILSPIEEGKRYQLSVSTDPALKPGQYSQTVKLLTDHPTSAEVKVQLDVTVFAKVFAVPNTVSLYKLPFNIDLATLNLPLIYVRKVRETGLQLKSVSTTLPFVKLEVKTETEGQFYTIRLILDKSKIEGVGEFKGEIQVETNDAEVPVIKIPVQGSFVEN